MTENISNLIVAATSLCGGIVVALLAGMAIWTFRDIRSRTRDPLAQILATVMVGVIPIAGILVYFMLRPRETLQEKYVRALEEESLLASIEDQEFCPTCGRKVGTDMQFCPTCHTKLRNPCGNCGRAVHLSWELCPYCGSGLTPELPATTVKKPEPKKVAQPLTSITSTKPVPVQVAQPSSAQSARARLGIGDLLDKVGGAVGGVVDKVSAGRGDDEQPALKGELVDNPDEAIPPASNNGNGTPSQQPIQRTSQAKNLQAQQKKPLISRDELE
jgi:RNA polymerase subunit RPABC4/transcription elongation factor Spt4